MVFFFYFMLLFPSQRRMQSLPQCPFTPNRCISLIAIIMYHQFVSIILNCPNRTKLWILPILNIYYMRSQKLVLFVNSPSLFWFLESRRLSLQLLSLQKYWEILESKVLLFTNITKNSYLCDISPNFFICYSYYWFRNIFCTKSVSTWRAPYMNDISYIINK